MARAARIWADVIMRYHIDQTNTDVQDINDGGKDGNFRDLPASTGGALSDARPKLR